MITYRICLSLSISVLFQGGRLGGCGICVSAELGHLPFTGGGPRTPKGMGGSPSDQYCSFFSFLFFFFFFVMPCGLWDLAGSQAGGWARAPVVGVPSPNRWTNREPQTPGNINQSEAFTDLHRQAFTDKPSQTSKS